MNNQNKVLSANPTAIIYSPYWLDSIVPLEGTSYTVLDFTDKYYTQLELTFYLKRSDESKTPELYYRQSVFNKNYHGSRQTRINDFEAKVKGSRYERESIQQWTGE